MTNSKGMLRLIGVVALAFVAFPSISYADCSPPARRASCNGSQCTSGWTEYQNCLRAEQKRWHTGGCGGPET